MQITRGKIRTAQKVVIYGAEGIGKSTLASKFPNPVFIDTEGSTKHMDVARFDKPTSWAMLLQMAEYVRSNPRVCGTLVIDTADWAEQLCTTHVCSKADKSSIEDFGYGKGYVLLVEEFGRLLNLLEEIVERGVNVVITAHAKMRKFEQPNESGAYDRWELKLSRNVGPMVKEWADMVLFANYKIIAVKNENKKVKAQGGERVMYTSHHPCWDAKNRHGLAAELPFSFDAIKHIFDGTNTAPAPAPIPAPPVPEESAKAPVPAAPVPDIPEVQPQGPAEPSAPPDEKPPSEWEEGIPRALLDLMKQDDVDPSEVMQVVADKGYYPLGTPIKNYDPQFIQGVLVGAWPQVYQKIKADRENLPFKTE